MVNVCTMSSMSDSSPSPAKNLTMPPEIPADVTKTKRPRSSHADLLKKEKNTACDPYFPEHRGSYLKAKYIS